MANSLHCGIYRGVVVNNADPESRGRLELQIPQLSGTEITDWVEPSVSNGLVIPNPGQIVYVQYEGGDARYPVWVGMATGQGVPAGNFGNSVTTDPLANPDPLTNPGALRATHPRNYPFSNIATNDTTGKPQMVAIYLPAGLTISSITFITGGTSVLAPTHYWFGLYNQAGNLLANTADQLTAAWGNNTAKTLPIAATAAGSASTFTTTYSGLHYLSVSVTASSGPTFMGVQSQANMTGNVLTPVLEGLLGSAQTTPPAYPFAAGTITPQSGRYFYSFVS